MKWQRKHLLLGLLGLMVGGYLIQAACDRFYFQPLAKEQQLAISLRKKIAETRFNLKRLDQRLAAREEIRSRALPADLEVASSLYQAWLINLVTSLGLTNPKVDSTSPVSEDDLSRLQFNLRGKANLRQFSALLFEFYRAGHLQKIRQISLTPSGGSEQMDLSLSVEALSLANSHNETELTSLPSGRLVSDQIDAYQTISQRNIFGKGLLSPVIRSTRLTAITSDRYGKREAWFHVEKLAVTHYLEAGEIAVIDSLELKIVEVHRDSVVLEIDGKPGVLEVGKSFAEMVGDEATRPF